MFTLLEKNNFRETEREDEIRKNDERSLSKG